MFRKSLTLLALFFSYLASAQQQPSSVALTYCIDPDWMPYEGIKQGKHIGISKDYLTIIGVQANIQFLLLPTRTWSETVSLAKAGECDVIPLLNASTERRGFLDFSLPYFEAPNVLVTRRGEDAIPGFSAVGERKLGIVKNYRHVEYLSRYYEQLNLIEVNNEQQGLEQLSAGNVDVMVGSLLSVNAIINDLALDNLVVSGYAELHDTLSMGVLKKHKGILERINTAILSIPESKKVEVYRRWYQVKPIAYSTLRWVLPLVLLVMALIACTVWMRLQQKRNRRALQQRDNELSTLRSALQDRNRALAFLATHDDVTELNNRNFILQKVEDEISRFHRFRSPATLLLVYADKLQKKATIFGQDSADEVMRKLAHITLERTREVDISARWSNDEILILCPQTSILSAQILAERILTEVELQSLQAFDGIKVSVGAALLKENDNFADWFERVSNAVKTAQKQLSHGFSASAS